VEVLALVVTVVEATSNGEGQPLKGNRNHIHMAKILSLIKVKLRDALSDPDHLTSIH
jgi:hypothetical protein